MKNYIEMVEKKVSIDEGIIAIEQFIINVYFESPISNKELSRLLMIPIPLVTAIKKEFIKLGIVKQEKGITITKEGVEYVENGLGYCGLDKILYLDLKNTPIDFDQVLQDEISLMEEIIANRPEVDRAIDQAHCSVRTSLKRAMLSLKHNVLINKKILCIGDDDLVSVALALLIAKLFDKSNNLKTEIHVFDLDKRLLDYINSLALENSMPIVCHYVDFKYPLDKALERAYDCFYTDPPYTMSGMNLFLSRGISALKAQKGLPIFFSFGHKSYDFGHKMISSIGDMGISIQEVNPRFNEYEGGGIIGNIGQLFTMYTTSVTKPKILKQDKFCQPLYTREVRNHAKALAEVSKC